MAFFLSPFLGLKTEPASRRSAAGNSGAPRLQFPHCNGRAAERICCPGGRHPDARAALAHKILGPVARAS